MNRSAVAAVALAMVVLLAGCGGSGDAGLETDTPMPTAEETPITTPTPSLADVSMPAGVSETGVTDRSALVQAHADGLDGVAATVEIDFRLTVDGEGQNVALRGKVTPGDDQGWMHVSTRDGVGTYYTEGETTYEKVEVGEETTYGTTDQVSAIPSAPRFGTDARLYDALSNANWTFDRVVSQDGALLLRYEATEVTLPDGVDVDREDGSATADGVLLVGEDGIVRHVDIGLTVVTDTETVEYGLSISISDIGSTTIDQPDWVEHAEDNQ